MRAIFSFANVRHFACQLKTFKVSEITPIEFCLRKNVPAAMDISTVRHTRQTEIKGKRRKIRGRKLGNVEKRQKHEEIGELRWENFSV